LAPQGTPSSHLRRLTLTLTRGANPLSKPGRAQRRHLVASSPSAQDHHCFDVSPAPTRCQPLLAQTAPLAHKTRPRTILQVVTEAKHESHSLRLMAPGFTSSAPPFDSHHGTSTNTKSFFLALIYQGSLNPFPSRPDYPFAVSSPTSLGPPPPSSLAKTVTALQWHTLSHRITVWQAASRAAAASAPP
jgi:hypothetical protein